MIRTRAVLGIAVGAVLAFVALASPVEAVSFDHGADFSTTANPNLPWSYRSAAIGAPNSTSALLPVCCSFGGWFLPSDSIFSIVGASLMHPGTGVDTILAFEFPASAFLPGLVSLDVDVVDSNSGGDGQVFSVWKNDALLANFPLAPISAPFSIDLDIPMDVGDSIFLRLNKNGDFFFDGVNLSVTVAQTAAVPEPGTLFLLGWGVAGVGAVLVRRRRRGLPIRYRS